MYIRPSNGLKGGIGGLRRGGVVVIEQEAR